ncbi:hypothetical protein [uncultured Aliiroseovarius sp.]|uniref:hypothetical protein n=1 Tax=uncultured Aliiroseovarius sp. TaxID=1658783 RepID=UPI002635C08C|nr:hypothetical protein [uncultured Aliiroseovarius sp.]
MLQSLGLFARYGRFVLVAGLLAGLALPAVAQALRPWLSEMVLFLLFLTAFRVGFPATHEGLRRSWSVLGVVLTYQLVLPLVCLGVFGLFGLAQSPVTIALTLMLAAPPLTGSPNLSLLLGHSPEPAFRLLVLGTLLLPLTLIPVFWFSPALGSLTQALAAALRLGAALGVTIAFAFVARALLHPNMSETEIRGVDGLTILTLAIVVVGLMSALAPALSTNPAALAGWLFIALVINLGLQVIAYLVLNRGGDVVSSAPMAVVAGNRNVALFLVASSATQTDSFLMFLGCYQIPMYLTPFLMRPLLGRRISSA